MLLTAEQRRLLPERYQGVYPVSELGYSTVRDYCDSCDYLPFLSSYQGDLKDFERPWTVKAILGTCPKGSTLLEIGAGEPIVAQALAELGYKVVVVDPYDGSARGPTEYQYFRSAYSDVKIQRALFSPELPDLPRNAFSCVYSISVLEHISGSALSLTFQAIRTFLAPGGLSLHSIDHVIEGRDAEFHHQNLTDILKHQLELSRTATDSAALVETLESNLRADIDTYYLSAAGHNLWRGQTPYDQFPYRKVASILSCHQMA